MKNYIRKRQIYKDEADMEEQKVNILLVDDRRENLLALEAVLDSPTYSLISATSGEEALKWVLKRDFAVILLDVQMPGLDGFETAKLIRARQRSKDIPIIFVTALSQTQDHVMNGYSVGAIDYIFKPFLPTVLKSKVEGFVNIYLSQLKIEEQNRVIVKHTREIETAYRKLKVSEEERSNQFKLLEELVQQRTKELMISNENLQREIEEKRLMITELQQSREFIKESEKLNVVGQLAAGIAHEIRNPLTSLRGFTQLLNFRLNESNEYITIMLNEIDRINTIVSELLLFSKPNQDDFQKIELLEMLRSIVTLMEAQANLHGTKIKIKCDSTDIYLIYGLENKIKQVFINLLKNAIEAMPDGGDVTIYLQQVGDRVSIRFVDQGDGIPEEYLEKIGQPFFTTKEKGTGLGMMVCQSIIDSHEGTMDIQSEVGKGTTIEIILNAYETALQEV